MHLAEGGLLDQELATGLNVRSRPGGKLVFTTWEVVITMLGAFKSFR